MVVHPGSRRVAARRTVTQFLQDVAIYWAASLELRSVIQGRWRPMATRRATRYSGEAPFPCPARASPDGSRCRRWQLVVGSYFPRGRL